VFQFADEDEGCDPKSYWSYDGGSALGSSELALRKALYLNVFEEESEP
jgi:hypothetical protein